MNPKTDSLRKATRETIPQPNEPKDKNSIQINIARGDITADKEENQKVIRSYFKTCIQQNQKILMKWMIFQTKTIYQS